MCEDLNNLTRDHTSSSSDPNDPSHNVQDLQVQQIIPPAPPYAGVILPPAPTNCFHKTLRNNSEPITNQGLLPTCSLHTIIFIYNSKTSCKMSIKFAEEKMGSEPRFLEEVVEFIRKHKNPFFEMERIFSIPTAITAINSGEAVAAVMNVNSEFSQYTGGVFETNINRYERGSSVHAIAIIGYGVDEHGLPYWMCRTSWGEDFGEQGFFRIIRGINLCQVEDYLFGVKRRTEELSSTA
jgi:hypothetical protein